MAGWQLSHAVVEVRHLVLEAGVEEELEGAGAMVTRRRFAALSTSGTSSVCSVPRRGPAEPATARRICLIEFAGDPAERETAARREQERGDLPQSSAHPWLGGAAFGP